MFLNKHAPIWISLLLFFGCQKKISKIDQTTRPAISNVLNVEPEKSLSICQIESEGILKYSDNGLIYRCTDSTWIDITTEIKGIPGPDGKPGKDGIKGDPGKDGYNIGEKLTDLYQKVRLSIYQLKVICTNGSVFYGTGWRYLKTQLITNHHVAYACEEDEESLYEIQIFSSEKNLDRILDQEPIIWQSRKTHPISDLAKIDHSESLKGEPLAINASGEVIVGSLIATFGFPLGLKNVHTELGHIVTNDIEFIGSDFTINADSSNGSSGSPIIDLATGLVIGVINSGIVDDSLDDVFGLHANKILDF